MRRRPGDLRFSRCTRTFLDLLWMSLVSGLVQTDSDLAREERGGNLIEITRSRFALVFTAVGALAVSISYVVNAAAIATLSSYQESGTTRDLIITDKWLRAVGAVLVLIALGTVAWKLILRSQAADFWEVAGATVATLLYAIGRLIAAAQAMTSPELANILAAIGIGGWAIVLVAGAGRHSILQHVVPSAPRTAGLWLAASIAALLLAVSAGLPTASLTDQGLELATTILSLAGTAILIATLTVARTKGFITWNRPALMIGLWLLAGTAAGEVGLGAVIFGPSPSLTSIRIGFPIVYALGASAYFVLAVAAWGRAMMLSSPPALTLADPATELPYPCGHNGPPNAQLCPSCGAPTMISPTL